MIIKNNNKVDEPMPFFSIILAGYQTEPYLSKALDSIVNQTFRDFEAICYVEESTDNSLQICHSVAEHDSRFKVVSAPKSGAVSSTRNYGIDHAKGEYLVILDGDDWLAENTLEKLSAKLLGIGQVDILSFAAISTESENINWEQSPRITNFSVSDEQDVFTGQEAIRRVGRKGGKMNNQTVLATYRVAFLREHHLYQKVGMVMEDFEWTPRVWFYAQRFAYMDKAFYAYRRRPNSLTTEASSRIVFDLVRQLRSLLAFVMQNKVSEEILTIWSNQWMAILYWFLFHPITSRKISDSDRKNALSILLEGEGKSSLQSLVSRVSLPRRLAWPLLLLAAKGIQFPAKFFFRQFYYPIIMHKR